MDRKCGSVGRFSLTTGMRAPGEKALCCRGFARDSGTIPPTPRGGWPGGGWPRGANLSEATLYETIFADLDLSSCKGLESCGANQQRTLLACRSAYSRAANV